jgi:hypothetical protein
VEPVVLIISLRNNTLHTPRVGNTQQSHTWGVGKPPECARSPYVESELAACSPNAHESSSSATILL